MLDSLGVGEAIDANQYNDTGANTLKHIMNNRELFIPNLEKLGFLNTLNIRIDFFVNLKLQKTLSNKFSTFLNSKVCWGLG